jgi:signal transduction histidine kinase
MLQQFANRAALQEYSCLMRFRLWSAVAASFATLLFLLPLFAWLVSREADQIHTHTRMARQRYKTADDAISSIQANINKVALLKQNSSSKTDALAASKLLSDLRRTTNTDCGTLIDMLGAKYKAQIVALQQGLDGNWLSINHNLNVKRPQYEEQQPSAETQHGTETLLDLAGRIDALNQANLAQEEQEIETQRGKLRRFSVAAVCLLLSLEFAIAVFTSVYLARLDRTSETERKRAEDAESELRRLSNRLVGVQEEERKIISRELHDEVGQILTGLRMELGTLSSLDRDDGFPQRLESVKRLTEEALRSVRNLALLVRPSMLDDLGLQPALQWQAKEFSRRHGVPASVSIQGELDGLPESHRLCLYRAVQEAMTNCGKHADATRVSVNIKQENNRIYVSVRDDGRGFDPSHASTRGLGLLGMKERVRALEGSIDVTSTPGQGTLLALELPTTLDLSDSHR